MATAKTNEWKGKKMTATKTAKKVNVIFSSDFHSSWTETLRVDPAGQRLSKTQLHKITCGQGCLCGGLTPERGWELETVAGVREYETWLVPAKN